jgi:alpha-tubulin suppressor-like RCC1 family protein
MLGMVRDLGLDIRTYVARSQKPVDDAQYVGDPWLPVAFPAGSFATRVAVGERHSCAILADGAEVRCWGNNNYGQLGLGHTDFVGRPSDVEAAPPVDLGRDRSTRAPLRVSKLALGSEHSCALLTDGGIKCWGNAGAGRLGYGDTINRGDGSGAMGDSLPRVNLGRAAVDVALGYQHSCALLDDHTVKCWGYNGNGQLGVGDISHRGESSSDMGDALPTIDFGGRTAYRIMAGSQSQISCALLRGSDCDACRDEMVCWGRNQYNVLGTGDLYDRGKEPLDLVGLFVDVGSMKPHGDSAVESYPESYPDRYPDRDFASAPLSGRASARTTMSTCVLMEDRRVKCFGRNDYDLLAITEPLKDDANWLDGHTTDGNGNPKVPLYDADSAPFASIGRLDSHEHQLHHIVALEAGKDHACALSAIGEVTCWGYCFSSHLCHVDGLPGSPLDFPDSTDGQKFPGAKFITAGFQFTCIITYDDQARCWGNNGEGKLGLGRDYTYSRTWDSSEVTEGIDLGTGRHAVYISAGNTHACAALDDGSVKCWGSNWDSELGNGLGGEHNRENMYQKVGEHRRHGLDLDTMGDNLPRVDLGTGHTASQVEACHRFSCAILDQGGKVKCWGYNVYGVIGAGYTSNPNTQQDMGDSHPFVNLGDDFEAKQLACVGESVCAVSTAGVVKCWGKVGEYGQLGLGYHQDTRPTLGGDAATDPSPLPSVDVGTGYYAQSLSGGGHADAQARHACAHLLPTSDCASLRTAAGLDAAECRAAVKCWGEGGYGMLGNFNSRYHVGEYPGEMGDNNPILDFGAGVLPATQTVFPPHDPAPSP